MKKYILAFVLIATTGWAQAQNDTLPFASHRAVSFGTDLTRLPWFLFGGANETFIRYEINPEVAFRLAGGAATYLSDTVFRNVVSYKNSGWFIKPGVQFFLPFSSNIRIGFGASYIRSFYSEQGTARIRSNFWNSFSDTPFKINGASLDAFEWDLSAEVSLNKNWFICPGMKVRHLIGANDPAKGLFFSNGLGERYESHYVPGIGFPYHTNFFRRLGFSINLVYRLPVKSK